MNRLVSFTLGGTSAEYLYDFSGRRIRKTVGGQATWFLWDGARLVAKYDGAGVRTARYGYVGMAFVPAQFSDLSGTYWTHTDHLGAVRMLTAANGTSVWEAQYTAYGSTVIDADPDANGQQIAFRLRLPGQYEDVESGLYYNLARYYDPALGRYLEEDPLPSANQYAYANGNPFSFIDPLGLTVYKYPPNTYSDRPPPPGTPCQKAIFRRGVLLGWEPCESCTPGGGDGPPGGDDDDGDSDDGGSGPPGGGDDGDDGGDDGGGDDGGGDNDGDNDCDNPIRQFVADHGAVTFSADVPLYGPFGVTFNVSATPNGMSWYAGGGVVIGGGWALTGDLSTANPGGWGGNVNVTAGNGTWGGYAGATWSQDSGIQLETGGGRAGGLAGAATGGYFGQNNWWGCN